MRQSLFKVALVVALIVIASLLAMESGESRHVSVHKSPTRACPVLDMTGNTWMTTRTLTSNGLRKLGDVLVSEPFSTRGVVRLVLEMPEGDKLDCVIGAVVPAHKLTDASALMATIPEGSQVMLMPIYFYVAVEDNGEGSASEPDEGVRVLAGGTPYQPDLGLATGSYVAFTGNKQVH